MWNHAKAEPVGTQIKSGLYLGYHRKNSGYLTEQKGENESSVLFEI